MIQDELAVVPDLRAVLSRDIGDRRAPAVDIPVGEIAAVAAIHETGDPAVVRAARGALLGDGDEQVVVWQIRLHAVAHGDVGAEPRFEEHAAGEGRRPRHLLHGGRRVVVAARLGCRRRRAAAHARRAQRLLILIEIELVLRVGLPREADVHALPGAVVLRLGVWVGHVRPRVDVAGVDVVEHAGDELAVALVARRREEPQPVSCDRSADRAACIPDLLHQIRRREAGRLQRGCVVAGLQRVVGPVREEAARHRVAALARHQIHRRSADFQLTERARRREHDFLRVRHVGDRVRDPGAVQRSAER